MPWNQDHRCQHGLDFSLNLTTEKYVFLISLTKSHTIQDSKPFHVNFVYTRQAVNEKNWEKIVQTEMGEH